MVDQKNVVQEGEEQHICRQHCLQNLGLLTCIGTLHLMERKSVQTHHPPTASSWHTKQRLTNSSKRHYANRDTRENVISNCSNPSQDCRENLGCEAPSMPFGRTQLSIMLTL